MQTRSHIRLVARRVCFLGGGVVGGGGGGICFVMVGGVGGGVVGGGRGVWGFSLIP